MAKNMTKISKICLVKAKEIAEPRSGAEHGVASKTASIPERKFGMKIFFLPSALVIFVLRKFTEN